MQRCAGVPLSCFSWLAVLWVGLALSCWMRHPEKISQSQDKAREVDVERTASSDLIPAAKSFAAESQPTVHNCACRLEQSKKKKMWAKIGFPWLADLTRS